MRRTLLGLAMVMAACQGRTPAAAELARAFAPAHAELDARDQYALARAIEAARGQTLRPTPDAVANVRGAWQGRRYRWEVGFIDALCRGADNCVALPFDHALHPDERFVHGWLPRLKLAQHTWTTLRQQCTAHQQCVFAFEGKLSNFAFSADEPTSLTFDEIEVQSVRGAAPHESWIARPAPRDARRRP